MGSVVIHAGRPKAGSSSIQAWLRQEAESLRSSGTLVAVASRKPGERKWAIRPYEGGGVNSGVVSTVRRGFPEVDRILDRFFEPVSELADEWDTVILSSENFANLFAPPDDGFIAGLRDLAGKHTVKIAYYVRPQHQALVASWTQWGFYRHEPASVFLRQRAEHLDYLSTLDHVAQLAPGVEFRVRPLRRDLLRPGGLIADFAGVFLDREITEQADLRVNAGLPLDVVNLVRMAPEGMLWRDEAAGRGGGTRRVNHERWRRLGPLLQEWEVEESASARAGREVVHRYAHNRFEASNRALIEREGWPTNAFIDEPTSDRPGDLDLVDDLWDPGELTPIQQMFLLALCQLGDTPSPGPTSLSA